MSPAAEHPTRRSQEANSRRYDRLARVYSTLEPLYLIFPPARRRAVAALGLEAGDVVLEIGAGTGRNFPYLVEAVGPTGRVIGVDASEGMLAEAAKLIGRRGWSNVHLLRQDAARLEVEGDLDGVLFSLSYSAMPEPRPALARAWERLRPSARVVVMDMGLTEGRLGKGSLRSVAFWSSSPRGTPIPIRGATSPPTRRSKPSASCSASTTSARSRSQKAGRPSLDRLGVDAVHGASRAGPDDPVALRHRPRQDGLEGPSMPGVCLVRAPDVEVDELVGQRLQHVPGADPGIGGEREAKLARHREPDAVGTLARPPHLQLGLARGERPAGECGQPPQPRHLRVKADAGDGEVGGMAPQARNASFSTGLATNQLPRRHCLTRRASMTTVPPARLGSGQGIGNYRLGPAVQAHHRDQGGEAAARGETA